MPSRLVFSMHQVSTSHDWAARPVSTANQHLLQESVAELERVISTLRAKASVERMALLVIRMRTVALSRNLGKQSSRTCHSRTLFPINVACSCSVQMLSSSQQHQRASL